MDDKVHEGIKVHEKEESDGDSIWQLKCNIIDKEPHSTCSNKTHWWVKAHYNDSLWVVTLYYF